jgi:hypothetical protein
MKCNIETIRRYSHRLDRFITGVPTYLWAFTGRLPYSDMKLIRVVKALVHDFWHDNTRSSCNQKYALKLRRGARDYDLHIKHFLEISIFHLTWAKGMIE